MCVRASAMGAPSPFWSRRRSAGRSAPRRRRSPSRSRQPKVGDRGAESPRRPSARATTTQRRPRRGAARSSPTRRRTPALRALTESRQREAVEREKAKEEAALRVVTDEVRAKEHDEARRAPEEGGRAARGRGRGQRKGEEIARKHLVVKEEEEEAPRTADARHKKERPVRRARGEERRVRGRLTITNALDEEQRQRSLASLKRHRERQKKQTIGPAGAAEDSARGGDPRGHHHPGARQPHGRARRRRHQVPDERRRDAQDHRRDRLRYRSAHRRGVRPYRAPRVGGRRRGRLHRRRRSSPRTSSRARRSSPSWAMSITARPRCSTPSARPTWCARRPAASPSISAPIRW